MWNTWKLVLDGFAAIHLLTMESRQGRAEVGEVAGGFAGSQSEGSIWVEEKPAWHSKDLGSGYWRWPRIGGDGRQVVEMP